MPRLRSAAIAACVLAVAASLTGCNSIVTMKPADEANAPDCAAVTVRLPKTVDGQERRWTDAQATGAWGVPTDTVLLHCGVAEPGPSTLPCVTIGSVDWLADDSEAPYQRYTTYGRSPAVEVYLDSREVVGRAVLEALEPAVRMLPTTDAVCTDRP